MNEIKKRCEAINKSKEDSSILEKFEQIYSNFMISKRTPKNPKIIRNEEPSEILKSKDDIIFNEQNLIDKNLSNIIRKPTFDSKKHVFFKEETKKDEETNIKCNKKKQLIKKLMSSKEPITKRIIKNDINRINSISHIGKKEEKKSFFITEKNDDLRNKKKLTQMVIEKMKKNKQRKNTHEKTNPAKVYKNKSKSKYKHKERKSMKDIDKNSYGFFDNDITLKEEKKSEIKKAYEILFNQGFYTKKQSQVNLLDNIDKNKKENNRIILSKKSKELQSFNKIKDNIKSPTNNYDNNNIYKPINSNKKHKNDELSFRPELNEKTIKFTEKLEDLGTTRSKFKAKAVTPKKIYVKKGECNRCLKRTNSLYLDGVGKIAKKRKLSICSPTSFSDESDFDLSKVKKRFNSTMLRSTKNSRNTYYKQIQLKKKLILENIKRKKIYNDYDKSQCNFKPQKLKRNLKSLFKKHLSETDIKTKKKKSIDSYLNPKKIDFNIFQKGNPFINNDDDINKSNINNNRICLFYQKDKYNECDKSNKIEISMIQRKLSNLEKFFSKQSL